MNGVPEMAVAAVKGWSYIGAGLRDAFDSVTGAPSSDYLSGAIQAGNSYTGEVWNYDNGLQRMGGYAGEFASPGAYGAVARLGAGTVNAFGNVVSESMASALKPYSTGPVDVVTARYDTAYNFYTQAGFSIDRALGHLDGIDFSQPVSATELMPGSNYVQHVLNGNVGNYFAPIGTSADAIGVNPTGRITGLYTPTQPTAALRSSAAEIIDTWTTPGHSYATTGGGAQFFVPNKQFMKPVGTP